MNRRYEGLIKRDITSFFIIYKSYLSGKKEKRQNLIDRLAKLEYHAEKNKVYEYYQKEFEKQRSRLGVVINFDD